ncbi:unnamed protein product [Allacma fusca]|uniref:Uncharacterized protein n=1 Tax=Allacma fusca TaxID=39272 RepID=A0A8J2L118_9HEXA|nr:unnamed protein product [Allacma fusca]
MYQSSSVQGCTLLETVIDKLQIKTVRMTTKEESRPMAPRVTQENSVSSTVYPYTIAATSSFDPSSYDMNILADNESTTSEPVLDLPMIRNTPLLVLSTGKAEASAEFLAQLASTSSPIMPTTLNFRSFTSEDTTVSTQSPLEIKLSANESFSELNDHNSNGKKRSWVDSYGIRVKEQKLWKALYRTFTLIKTLTSLNKTSMGMQNFNKLNPYAFFLKPRNARDKFVKMFD